MKKILFVIHALSVGGAEKFLVSLINNLDAKNFDLTLISLSEKNPLRSELNNNVRFIAFPRNKKFDISGLFKIRKLIKVYSPDFIFSVGFFSFFTAYSASVFLKYTRKIISYHTTIPRSKKEDLLNGFYKRFINKNDLVITVSNIQMKYTSERYNIPIKLFKTIHNGVDTNYWRLPSDSLCRIEFRAKYGLPADAMIIIITAAFRAEKNHSGAIKALNILHKQYHTKAYLLLVGDGLLREQIETLRDDLDLDNYVILAGIQKDVRPFYWASDLFTLCSDSVETFSIAALEAMACGLPVVLTNVGGASEMISKTTGLLCEVNEADIAQKWHKALNFDFSKEAIHTGIAQKFQLSQMIDAYSKILSD